MISKKVITIISATLCGCLILTGCGSRQTAAGSPESNTAVAAEDGALTPNDNGDSSNDKTAPKVTRIHKSSANPDMCSEEEHKNWSDIGAKHRERAYKDTNFGDFVKDKSGQKAVRDTKYPDIFRVKDETYEEVVEVTKFLEANGFQKAPNKNNGWGSGITAYHDNGLPHEIYMHFYNKEKNVTIAFAKGYNTQKRISDITIWATPDKFNPEESNDIRIGYSFPIEQAVESYEDLNDPKVDPDQLVTSLALVRNLPIIVYNALCYETGDCLFAHSNIPHQVNSPNFKKGERAVTGEGVINHIYEVTLDGQVVKFWIEDTGDRRHHLCD